MKAPKATRQPQASNDDRRERDDPVVAEVFERDAWLNLIVERLFEVHRTTVAAEVAISVGDDPLTYDSLRRLVSEVKIIANAWDKISRGTR
jgi:hypothetical protein